MDISKFEAAKFNHNFSTFYRFILNKNKNLYSLHYVLKHKIYTVCRANTGTCSDKNATSLYQK